MTDGIPAGREAAAARRQRQEAALRDNLHRRKAQARARAETPASAETPPPPGLEPDTGSG